MNFEEYLIEAAALGLMCSSALLVRRQLLSIRYGLGWLAVSVAGLAVGPLLALLQPEVRRIGFTPTGFSLGIFVAFLLLLSLQLSISLSGLHHQIRDLAEHGALLEARVMDLETTDRRS